MSQNLQRFLEDAKKYCVLNYEEEVALCRSIFTANVTKRKILKQCRHHTLDESAIMEKGDMAWEKLVQANLGLVIKIAANFAKGDQKEMMDLISDGTMGLMKAAREHDPDKGRFSTYATPYIRAWILRSLLTRKLIHIPINKYWKAIKLHGVIESLHDSLGRPPTEDEIAGKAGISVEELEKLMQVFIQTESLNDPISEDGMERGEMIADEQAVMADESLRKKESRGLLDRMLSKLDERSQSILHLRHGLDTEQPHTLQELAVKFRVSPERIRQIENEALHKLRQWLNAEQAAD